MAPRTPLLNPSQYFRRGDRPSLSVAAAVVTTNAVLTTVLIWWFIDSLTDRVNVSEGTQQAAMSEVTGQIVFAFFGVFAGWLLLAGIIHLFMWFAGAERGFGTTLAIVGEAMLVSIVMLPLVALGFVLLLDQVPSNLEAAAEFMRQAAERSTPVLMLVTFVRMLWEASVQAVGLEVTHDISLGKAALVTFGLGLLIFVL